MGRITIPKAKLRRLPPEVSELYRALREEQDPCVCRKLRRELRKIGFKLSNYSKARR